MSFEIFLCCVRNGEGSAFKRELFEEIFARGAIDPRSPLTSVTYRDGGAQIDGAEDDEEIENLVFSHCGGETFYAALHELADRSGSFMTWPSDGLNIAVPSHDLVTHLPADFEDPTVTIVRSGRELAALIGATG